MKKDISSIVGSRLGKYIELDYVGDDPGDGKRARKRISSIGELSNHAGYLINVSWIRGYEYMMNDDNFFNDPGGWYEWHHKECLNEKA